MVSYRLRLIPRAIIQNTVGLPPIVFFTYLIVLGLTHNGVKSVFHPGLWILLGACIFWIYFFTAGGVLLLYGLLKFSYMTRSRRSLDYCLNDLLRVLRKEGVSYSVRKLIRGRIIRTKFGNILLVGLDYAAGPNIVGEYTVIFYTKDLREVIEFRIIWWISFLDPIEKRRNPTVIN